MAVASSGPPLFMHVARRYPLHIFGLIDVERIVKDYLVYSLVHLWDASLGAKENLFGSLVE
jgi:hypothetical protein